MAVARCEICGRPMKTKWDYPHPHVLSGRVMCGDNRCKRPANQVWLTDEEERCYGMGQRTFKVGGHPGEVPIA